MRDCYRFLVERYEPGDELFLFGFSRGAFTARSLAGLIRNAGILRREHAGRVDEAYRLYRARGDLAHPSGIESRIFRRWYSHEPDVHFIGVWDTVGALGIPGMRGRLAERMWGFHDTQLSSHVSNAFHALAIDERRRPFAPTLWDRPADAPGQTLEQVWFAGVHSDVGGGYPNPGLSEIALLWMAGRAAACGLAFDAGQFTKVATPDEERRRLAAEVAPDPLAELARLAAASSTGCSRRSTASSPTPAMPGWRSPRPPSGAWTSSPPTGPSAWRRGTARTRRRRPSPCEAGSAGRRRRGRLGLRLVGGLGGHAARHRTSATTKATAIAAAIT